MKKIWWIILAATLLCGCQMRTVDAMYCPPERSDDYHSLQTAINSAMTDLEYSAPLAGENRQIVQTVDLDGDGILECLLYAKGGTDLPMQILVFSQQGETYIHTQTIPLPGTSFDRVEYAQIDGEPGMEIVVGSQVSDQVSRSVTVLSFSTGEAEQLVTADYLNFSTVDLDANGRSEVFVLRAGPTETDRGIVELFSVQSGVMERSIEVNLSEPADHLKRILTGQLQGGKPAVYVASAVDEDTLITDVYAIVNGTFTNVSLSNESGTSMKTMRNYFVYADDIDADGVMELPSLIEMRSIDTLRYSSGQNLIRWFSMTDQGEEVDKLYTYHHFLNGWYMEIESAVAPHITVVDLGNVCDFYVWDQDAAIKVLSIYTLTGQSREEQSTAENRFVLYKGESTIFSAQLDEWAEDFGFTQDSVIRGFQIIREKWKTGET